jgi:mono/diheme cytochrome c family protein
MTRRQLAPPLALVAVTLATVCLAVWHPFSASAVVSGAAAATGDATRGRQVFATTCAGCHGADATGGVGPSLHGIGLTAAEVEAVIASGRGIMPSGLATGQRAADVAAYVASLPE